LRRDFFHPVKMKEYITSRNAVYETLKSGRRQVFRLLAARGVQEKGRLTDILKMTQSVGIPVERPPRLILDKIAQGHQGVALEVSGYRYADPQEILERAKQRGEAPFVLILDALQDPQNLGTLLRTADAVGVHGVFLPLRRTAQVTPAVVNASSGASEHLHIAQANLALIIERLKEDGLWVVGLEGGPQSQALGQVRLDGPLALVVGNEGQGMRALTRKSCDILVRLPMRGEIESLNAAVAGSVGLYMVWQARGFG
jgi:23S rRNA (guanosine2251-2'-O)-methyltransferase